MQRLFSRNDSGYWSTFQDSTGDSIDTLSRISTLRVWFAKGPALRKFDDEIRPELLSVLRNCDLPTTQEVFLRLYMVGRSPEQAKPMVMICCVDPRIRKHGKTAVKKSRKLDGFPEYGLSSRALPFESTGVLQPCQGTALDWDDTTDSHGVYPQPHSSLVGRRILSQADDSRAPRWATGGAILHIGDKSYQMTVSHFVRPKEHQCSTPLESEDWDLDGCELEEDFESQWGAEASITEESHDGDFQSTSVGVELPNHQAQSIQTVLAPESRLDHLSSTFGELTAACTESATITLREDVLDYALVEVDAGLAAESGLNENIFYDVDGATRTITAVSPVPAMETDVVVITSRGSLKGVLVPGSTTRRIEGANNFQDIYTVTLESEIREGDCGSAVVDSLSGTLYGHIVLGCVGTSLAYFVPATEVIQDIRHRTSKGVALSSSHRHGDDKTITLRRWSESTEGSTAFSQAGSRRFESSPSARNSVPSTQKATPEMDDDSNLSLELQIAMREYTRNRSNALTPPDKRFRLGYWSVMALVVNRMIGSGIFYSPAAVHSYTGGPLASLLFWTLGGVLTLMGTIVWLEFGLSIPRVTTPYGSFSTPRNGGDKNYLEYIYSSTAYRPKTWLLSTFLYGTMFITLGNMAGNAVSFSASLLRAAGAEDPGPSMTRLLAIGGVVLCFFLNVLSRRAGIWLNNVFALVKVLVLTVIILIGITIGVTGPRRANAESTDPSRLHTIDANIDTTVGSSTTSVGFTTALFSIVFAFSGFDEANFVLKEVDRPRRKFPRATLAGVSIVILLSIAMSACYELAAPTPYRNGGNMAETLFETLAGQSRYQHIFRVSGSTIFYAALALSSFGNIIVMTYTAARVTQEIAKEGVLPWSIPIANDTKSLLQRIWPSPKRSWPKTTLPEAAQTPVGGLVFQLALSIITILVITKVASPDDAYNLLSTLAAYSKSISAACLGVGVLCSGRLWRTSGSHWSLSHKSTLLPSLGLFGRFHRYWTTLGLTIFTLLSLEIVLLPWGAWLAPQFLDLQAFHGATQGWSLVPSLMAVPFVLSIGSLWFWGSVTWARYWERKIGKRFVVQRLPTFSEEEDEEGCKRSGQLILVHETVRMTWVPSDMIDATSPKSV